MKTKLNSILLVLTVLIISSACNSSRNLTVLKRHYSKGNYVSLSKKSKPYVYHNQVNQALQPRPETRATVSNTDAMELQVNEDVNIVSADISASNMVSSTIAPVEKPVFNKVKPSNKIDALKKIKRSYTQYKSEKSQGAEGARSLFWLVITILLIIWLIAIVSGGWGLGGLVNLLLLIALILFILWLLRLI